MQTLQQIELRLSNLSPLKRDLRLSSYELVYHPHKTCESLLKLLKSNKGNRTFLPYYKLLVRIIEKMDEG